MKVVNKKRETANDSQAAKESDFKVLRKLYALFAKHNKDTLIACVFLAFVDGSRPYVPFILSGILIDGLAAGVELSAILTYLGIGLAAIFVLQMLSVFLRDYFNSRIENCMERQNRDLNEQSMKLDYEDLENPAVQEKKRKQEQVVNVRGGIYWMLIWSLDKGLTGLINVITAAAVAAPLFFSGIGKAPGIMGSVFITLLMFAVLITCFYTSYKTNRMNSITIHKCFEEYAKCNKVSNYFLHNILAGSETAKDLRIFHQEKLVEEGIYGREEEAKASLKKIQHLYMRQNCLEKTLSGVSGGCIYIFAALKAYMGIISIGSVVRYASSAIKCVDGFVDVLLALASCREVADYGRDYLDYIELESRKENGKLPVKMNEDSRFLVEFENVSFKYPGSSNYVIRNLNLKLDIGERMAIVGKNGSGKTTFIKLLCRLYDVTEGVIKLNGIDIRRYDYEEYLKLFSVVFQDYRVFSLKLGENIAASEQVDGEWAIEALTRAGLKERFSRMKDGLDTYIGKEFDENGVNVSGGERQKIAIARAIYKMAPFVIMDEPTAALDPVSECDVYAGFDKMVGNKTAIYISHRLASCRFCNDILVFQEGNVIQRGSHDQLVSTEGLYRKLWDAQAQYYEI